MKQFVATELPYLTEVGYQQFEAEVLTTAAEKHVFISYLLGTDSFSHDYFIKKYHLGNRYKFDKFTSLLKYKLFYFFHSGLVPPSEYTQKAVNEFQFLKSYYAKAFHQSLNQDRRTLNWSSSVPSKIRELYASYSLAEMVTKIKQSKKLREFVVMDLPYLTEADYQKFEDEVLTTPFEKHVFISYLLDIDKTSYTDFVAQYDLDSHTTFYNLTKLLKYKFFYFFDSGKIPESEAFSNRAAEMKFFNSYYAKSTDNILSDDEAIVTTQADSGSQNEPRTLNWSSSVPSEISEIYVSYSPAEIVRLIKQSNKLKEFVGVGLPYLTEKGYQIFEEEVLTTVVEKHVFMSYLLDTDKLSRKYFMTQYNLRT
ncbi:MAG: hypothetical protein OXC40_03830, partial [Proteobacteria bacterium]|nr:hypothetical protein [Pseudomonadota bacterium]